MTEPTAGRRLTPGHPAAVLGVVALLLVVLGWQFITDASRAAPAFDTAYYQWRAEFLRVAEPAELIELRGATGALASGYRVAEPVLGALMQGVGGIAPETHAIVLSVLFRVLAAVGLAAFAWRHRRSWLLFYLTLLVVPALFLLQRFFGFMDNFFTLSLLAGALILLEPMRTSWAARTAVTVFLFLGGLSHPTTVAIFLLAMGAVAVYRLIRERSIGAVLRSEGPIIAVGTVAVVLTAAVWVGGWWGPSSSLSDAAVPPPETVSYFLNRSLGVVKNLQPFDQAAASPLLVWAGVTVLVGLMLVGLWHLLTAVLRRRDHFAEVTVAWTLPLAGMFGFLLGAAYPYFRFFNATLSPPLLAALGLAILIGWSLRARERRGGGAVAVVVPALAVALLAGWWVRGLSEWNRGSTWLTPEVRTTTAAAAAYLRAEPPGTPAVFVVDAQPGQIVPYGKYKEFANALYAGLDPEQIDDTELFFGRVEDLLAGRPTTASLPDPAYEDIAEETARETFAALDGEAAGAVVFLPLIFNEFSDNPSFVEPCAEDRCARLSESGLFVVSPPGIPARPPSEAAVAEAQRAARDATAFVADPPGPFSGLGGTLVTLVRLALLFLVPGLFFVRAMPVRAWPESLALVPLLSIAAVTAVGVALLGLIRQPLGDGLAWTIWGIATALGAISAIAARGWRAPQRSR